MNYNIVININCYQRALLRYNIDKAWRALRRHTQAHTARGEKEESS